MIILLYLHQIFFFKPNPTSQALLEKSSIGQTEREEKAKERGEA